MNKSLVWEVQGVVGRGRKNKAPVFLFFSFFPLFSRAEQHFLSFGDLTPLHSAASWEVMIEVPE